jgi:3-oxoacyl-[acyl-carrier-protein] synthase-3
MQRLIGFLSFGHAVPPHVRLNEDSIYTQIKSNVNSQGISEASLFTGTKQRHYLKPEETLDDLMVQAGQQALARAKLKPEQIDRLYGYASVSEFITPNALYKVHAQLNLQPKTMVVPINCEFSNFVTSAILAWEAIALGHCNYALIVCGCGWTRNLDYTQPHAFGIGDGAGAAVIGPSDRFTFIDYETNTFSNEYGVMTMQHRAAAADEPPAATYRIAEEAGIDAFLSTGMNGPPQLTRSLLAKHQLSSDRIAFIAHQASDKLINYWSEHLQPQEYFHTFEQFGNMTLASIPVTLSHCYDKITAEYIVLLALGIGAHQTALLIKTRF